MIELFIVKTNYLMYYKMNIIFTLEEAISHIDFNIIRSLAYNENSPIIMYSDSEDLLYELEQRRIQK